MQRTFTLVYSRPATTIELADLRERLGSDPSVDDVRLLRTAINLLDHQHHPTPFAVRFREADVRFVEIDNVILAVDDLDHSVSRPIAANHYETHLRPFFEAQLRQGATFVDVGANVGFYAVMAARAVGPTGRVHAFEPNPENCRLILLSAERNGFDNIEVHPVALGGSTGHALFHTHLGSNGGLVTSGVDALLQPTTTVAPLARLDDIIQDRVDLIKIDVEGAEGLVVSGATKLLDAHRPTVLTEFSLDMLRRVSGMEGADYLRLWTDRGYTPFLCDRASGELLTIEDTDRFVADFDSPYRIEDLVMRP